MLMILHQPKCKTFCLANFLAKKKEKKKLARCQASLLKQSSPYKKFLPSDDEKPSASAQRQAPHTGKIPGCSNSVEDAIRISRGLNSSEIDAT
jgi:hypothetical protein